MSAVLLLALAAIGVILLVNLSSNSQASELQSQMPTPPNAVVGAIAIAIATAEGFFTGAGSVPFDQNNPGDLTDYADLYGANANGITIFPSIEAGWNALYEKIQNILSGASSVYSPDMSLSELGAIWSGGDSNWASNVAAALGTSTDTTLGDYAAANSDTSDGSD